MAQWRKWLLFAVGIMMLTIFFGGIVLFPDAPVHECNSLTGYCGKQGQIRTAADFHWFQVWQVTLFAVWVPGSIAIWFLKYFKRGHP